MEIKNVTKLFNDKVIFKDFSVSIPENKITFIMGESGSGKSTMAHILGGIIPYESGEMYIYGTPTSHYGSSDWEHYRRDYVSFISQNYGILVGNTVLENVESALRFGGMEKEETRKRALEILEEVDLLEFKSRKAGKLSSGQKQRLSIARALAKPSKVLIADEPTGNLDNETADGIMQLLTGINKEKGTAIVMVTHNRQIFDKYPGRVMVCADERCEEQTNGDF